MDNYSCIDLNIIKNQIADLAAVNEAKSFIIDEEVSFNPLVINNKLENTKQALKILQEGNIIGFDGIENINNILDKADKSINLSSNEILKTLVFHNHCTRIKKLFYKFDKDLSIRDYSDSINVYANIFDEIEKCVDNSGEIKEDATDELRRINSELNQCQKDLYNKAYSFIDKHNDSLQEPNIFERNDRITFLVKNSDKNKFKGYTYGTSASGLACYIEPGSFIDLNNHKVQLVQDKEDEIQRICAHLTYLISSVSDDYRHNFESIVLLNVIFAKAQYGYDNNAIIAQTINNKNFEFEDLCHPLIDKNKVISNNYRLFDNYKGIVISGSNTGGKTVSLKAIGLSVIMSYLGIPIIASKALIPLYDNVYVDIDDNQSIQDSLSTFSAHISNIDGILKKATNKSLILIDELISGTDPKQAQAISLAILDEILDINSSFIITTHFDDVKNYSYEKEDILLSSVGFNMDNLMPTYRYIENSIGSSNALEIASRYFSNKKIIERSKQYLEINKTNQDKLVEKLNNELSDIEEIKYNVKTLEQNNIKLNNEYLNKIKQFDEEKQTLKQKYIDELNNYIEDIKEKAKQKLDNIKQEDKNIINNIANLKIDNIDSDEQVNISFNVGDNVRIKDNEQIGTILAINGNNATIDIRGITIKTKLSDLTLMPKMQKKKVTTEKKKYARVPSEINLVGQRVEDALVLMESYLDSAMLANMSSVKVIHGIGTGQLRTGIRNRLKKLSYVKSFKDGDYYDGSSAVTIVEFK